ncbi:hypothetical protein EYC84_003704 [Monilinia fructicola]|uniref:Uncharacterized protein n=1 Tax=Monilinia fructicola TaxID=38448 RepID=A0A5M9JUK1_MONFR|nr:hypothetical protein EYC84_003704 [Monilinia fructicola]
MYRVGSIASVAVFSRFETRGGGWDCCEVLGVGIGVEAGGFFFFFHVEIGDDFFLQRERQRHMKCELISMGVHYGIWVNHWYSSNF